MGRDSKIEWTHHTFNPWWGCTKVSAGCEHCYAETLATRFGVAWGPKGVRRIASEATWREPLRWNRAASAAGERHRVFCASMADVFEDRHELIVPRTRLFGLIEATPSLDWLLLTKRPEETERRLAARYSDGSVWFGVPANIWLGASTENQKTLDERLPALLAAPFGVKFLSCEPLLGPITLPTYTDPPDWVIVGGESGPGARPMHPDWVRSIRDQCLDMGVSFFFKQWGEHNADGHKVGKRAAGRLLDGRTWDEVPV